jgi:hypothetical protein
MAWLSSTLAGGCLAVGVLHVLRLVVLGRDRAAEVSYAAMGVGMAAMFSPFGDPVPAALWTTVFLLIGVWFVARALRAGNLAGDAAHHILGSVSMLFMLLSGHVHGGGPRIESVVAILLAGYFTWHVIRCVDRLRAACDGLHTGCAPAGGDPVPVGAPALAAPAPVATRPAVLLGSRAAALAHLVMTVAMEVMLLGMV